MTVQASEQHNTGVRGAARSFAALRMTVQASEQHNTGVRGAARSFAALRMTMVEQRDNRAVLLAALWPTWAHARLRLVRIMADKSAVCTINRHLRVSQE